MIPKDTIDVIFDTAVIEDVVQDFIELKKRGSNYIGLCPFHKEKTPSFTVSPVKGIYKCFGCGRAGNAINFVMEYKGYGYLEALKYIANKYSISIKDGESISTKPIIPKFYLVDILEEEIELFNFNSSDVFKLMNFDSLILQFCINNIEALNERLKNNDEVKINSPLLNADSTLKGLKGIARNESMKPQYDSMYNQCLVLLVSYFSSSAKQIFRKTIQYLVDEKIPFLGNKKDDIKLRFEELENTNFDLRNHIVDYIIDKKNISFQDMKSINRVYKDYFDIDIELNIDVDNIILALASRHTIVHNVSQADDVFMNQIRNTNKRQLKINIEEGMSLHFNPDEIKLIKSSMENYLSSLAQKINTTFT